VVEAGVGLPCPEESGVVCCILAALIIANILALWRARRRVVMYACLVGLIGLIALFVWQIGVSLHRGNKGLPGAPRVQDLVKPEERPKE
jgi:hypothetical protein